MSGVLALIGSQTAIFLHTLWVFVFVVRRKWRFGGTKVQLLPIKEGGCVHTQPDAIHHKIYPRRAKRKCGLPRYIQEG